MKSIFAEQGTKATNFKSHVPCLDLLQILVPFAGSPGLSGMGPSKGKFGEWAPRPAAESTMRSGPAKQFPTMRHNPRRWDRRNET